MKKRLFVLFAAFCIVLSQSGVCADNKPGVTFKYDIGSQKQISGVPETGSQALFAADPETGKIIYRKNADKPMYPASTTKILTALLVLENCKLTDMAEVSEKAVSSVPSDYVNARLQPGEKFSISDLLKALLIRSANEAAFVLAEHVSGSIEGFIDLMNKRAKELGCKNFNFVNPNGIHDEKHYCTAYDLYLITKECRKYDAFLKIVKTESFKLPATDIYPSDDRTFKTTNKLLLSGSYHYANCTGIKTGYTTPAGECLVASSSYKGYDLICVVLGGGVHNGESDRYADTIKLFDFAYNNYSRKTIARKGDVVTNITVGKATKKTRKLDVTVDSDISALIPDNTDEKAIKTSVSLNEKITAPIKQNQVLGSVTYYADGLIVTADIKASHTVKKIPYWLYNSIIFVFVSLTLLFIISFIKINIPNKKSRKKVRNIVITISCIEIILLLAVFLILNN